MKQTATDCYFLVHRDDIGSYGHEDGSTLEEIKVLLAESNPGEELVVIRGSIVPLRLVLLEGP